MHKFVCFFGVHLNVTVDTGLKICISNQKVVKYPSTITAKAHSNNKGTAIQTFN